MKSVFVISPHYLDAIFSEAEKFSFALHGYGNPEAASKGLLYANVNSILGFAIVYEQLPSAGSARFKELVDFIRKCNLLNSNKRFVIVTRGSLGNFSSVIKKFKSLQFTVHQNVEYVSDTVINRNIFGSILLDNYEPYIIKEKEEIKLGELNSPSFSFVPVIPGFITEIFSDLHLVDSVEDSVKFDLVWQKYNHQNQLIADLRELLIREKKKQPSDSLLIRIMEQIGQLELKPRCLYLACINEIRGRLY